MARKSLARRNQKDDDVPLLSGQYPTPPDPVTPFPPLRENEDPTAPFADELNDPNRVDLGGFAPSPIGEYTPPMAGGNMGTGGLFGQPYNPPTPTIGRPTSPPIWQSAHLHPNIPQLRVWKRVNGNPVLAGDIDALAGVPDFIQHFFELMPRIGEGSATFIIRPLNVDGQEVLTETTLPAISEHHTTLRSIREQRAGAAVPINPAISAAAATSDRLERMVEKSQDLYEKRIQSLEAAAQEERRRAVDLQLEVAKERSELASRAAMSVEAITERLMKSDADRSERTATLEADRNKSALESTQGMFATMLQMQQQAATRERDAADRRVREEADRRKDERADEDAKRVVERQDWERRRVEDERDHQRRLEKERGEAAERDKERDRRSADAEAERVRRHDREMEDIRQRHANDKAHMERMASLNTRTEKSESVEGVIDRVMGVVNKLGMKPEELLDRILGGKEDGGPNPLIEIVAKVVGEGIKTVGDVVKDRQRIAAGQGIPGAPGAAPFPYGYLAGPGADAAPAAPTPSTDAAPPADGTTPPTTEAKPTGPQSTLPLPTQKAARLAIRNLVRDMKSADKERWAGLVAGAVSLEPSVYHYVKEVSIRAAFIEAHADEAFVDAFFSHESINMIPAEVPRG
jgi:hypothetical protein